MRFKIISKCFSSSLLHSAKSRGDRAEDEGNELNDGRLTEDEARDSAATRL